MRKTEYLEKYGLWLSEICYADTLQARTDYQRKATYILHCKSCVHEWYTNGTMQELKEYVKTNGVQLWKKAKQYYNPYLSSR